MAKKAKVAESITLREIAESLPDEASGTNLSTVNKLKFLKAFIEAITTSLSDGVKVKIPDFGILQVRDRPARMGRNPATGATIKIKASKKVSFRVAKSLKEAVL